MAQQAVTGNYAKPTSSNICSVLDTNITLTPYPYDHMMHDSIQAFCARPKCHNGPSQSNELDTERLSPGITDIIQSEIMHLPFTGVLGHVQFDTKQERQTRANQKQKCNFSQLCRNFCLTSQHFKICSYSFTFIV